MRSDNLIAVQIYDWKPVLQTSQGCLIFLGKHEPNKVFITHLVLCPWLKFTRHLFKYTFYCLPWEGMTLVSWKVLFVDQEVMISIKLPESAIEHIEMFIGEILSDLIYIFLSCHCEQYFLQIWSLEVPQTYSSIIIDIDLVEYSHNYSVCITILKLWGRL